MKYLHTALIASLTVFGLTGAFVIACGGSDTTTDDTTSSSGGADGGGTPETSVTNPVAKVTCCPADPEPSCCMYYGGQVVSAGCVKTCDNMPVASDPDWKLSKDAYGCEKWSNPHDTFHGGTQSDTVQYCGAIINNPDASTDAGEDAD